MQGRHPGVAGPDAQPHQPVVARRPAAAASFVVSAAGSVYRRAMVTVTPQAARKARSLAEQEGVPPVLRLGVRGGGCSGLSYFYVFEQPPKEGDTVWETEGLTICCDRKSLTFLEGCELDYEEGSLLKRGFRFRNPQAKRSCSCGESFAL